jgi:hypothetical protein
MQDSADAVGEHDGARVREVSQLGEHVRVPRRIASGQRIDHWIVNHHVFVSRECCRQGDLQIAPAAVQISCPRGVPRGDEASLIHAV